jgi:hypothetical protein
VNPGSALGVLRYVLVVCPARKYWPDVNLVTTFT